MSKYDSILVSLRSSMSPLSMGNTVPSPNLHEPEGREMMSFSLTVGVQLIH